MNDNISPRPVAFGCFPLLPPEVRLRVWHFILSSPASFRFRHNCLFVIHRRAPLPTAAYNPHPPIRIPTHSLLLVGHEACHEAFRHFTASLQLHNSNPKIPINPDIDILYFAAHCNYITRSSLKNIKHLLIDCFY
jgi:hypothetical protein